MRSEAALERQPTRSDSPEVHELLVVWQHPDTRKIIPIGRFSRLDGGYSFAYTQAAASIDGFRPLPDLADLHRRYEASGLPAVFGQRVMAYGRPDFAKYARTIGLDPDRATPWEQIVHSGGRRAGDTLQFMPLPTVTDGRAVAQFLVSGLRHVPEEHLIVRRQATSVTAEQLEGAVRSLAEGDVVRIEAEDENRIRLRPGTTLGTIADDVGDHRWSVGSGQCRFLFRDASAGTRSRRTGVDAESGDRRAPATRACSRGGLVEGESVALTGARRIAERLAAL